VWDVTSGSIATISEYLLPPSPKRRYLPDYVHGKAKCCRKLVYKLVRVKGRSRLNSKNVEKRALELVFNFVWKNKSWFILKPHERVCT
jgi:hypothetical protein